MTATVNFNLWKKTSPQIHRAKLWQEEEDEHGKVKRGMSLMMPKYQDKSQKMQRKLRSEIFMGRWRMSSKKFSFVAIYYIFKSLSHIKPNKLICLLDCDPPPCCALLSTLKWITSKTYFKFLKFLVACSLRHRPTIHFALESVFHIETSTATLNKL